MLARLGHSQQTILQSLLTAPKPLTIDQLGENLGISKNAIYQHVGVLERTGLVEKSQLNRTGGRPSQSYSLSETGRNLFPKHYGLISTMLIATLKQDLGEERIAGYLEQMGEKLADDFAERTRGKPLPERVGIIVEILKELGYQAEVDDGDACSRNEIRAHNCVFHSIANSHNEVCKLDLAMIGKLGDAAVEHKTCMARGDACCTFRLNPRLDIPVKPANGKGD